MDAANESRKTPVSGFWGITLVLLLSVLLPSGSLQWEFLSVSPGRARAASCPNTTHLIAPDVGAVAHDIARRFGLAESAAVTIARAAFTAARARGIDPTLVLAIAAVESRFQPRIVNPATGAAGLMQVMPKYHQAMIHQVGGEPSLLLIAPNIDVGAAIIAEYLEADDGNIDDALEHYLGAGGADHYVKLVEREMAHLSRVLQAH